MTGSLDVRGRVLPVGGVTSKIEAAIEAGLKTIIIPKANAQDVYDKVRKKNVKIVEASNLAEVLEHALSNCPAKKELLEKIKKQSN
jgi:Lon-like ATP-dependent protease